jgi:hypothetical protein
VTGSVSGANGGSLSLTGPMDSQAKAPMPIPKPRSAAVDFWAQIRRELLHHYPELHEISPKATGKSPSRAMPHVVGAWGGRLWDVAFHPPRVLAPDVLMGVTTAVRLVEPVRMPYEPLPWLYVGRRPRALSRNFLDFDRIVMRYRRREGEFRGELTGDPGFDRDWAVYPCESELASVFREPEARGFLTSAAALGPDPRKELPTLAVFGTEATFTVPLAPRSGSARPAATMIDGFGRILDRLQEVRGIPSARQRSLPMDIKEDETGDPFPVPRFVCPLCSQETHPRFQGNLETEICEKCGKTLYPFR